MSFSDSDLQSWGPALFPLAPDDLVDPSDEPPDDRTGNENVEQWLTRQTRCELCKQRKVRCDRGRPACGWCTRNGAVCEYKERKKPGLRAGYGRELEQRLDRLEDILQSHARILESTLGRPGSHSIPSEHTTPQDSTFFRPPESHGSHGSRAEAALFLQKPSSFPSSVQTADYAASIQPQTPSMHSAHGEVFQQPQPHPLHSNTAQNVGFFNGSHPPLESPSLNLTQNEPRFLADNALPPYDLLYALTDLYFKHVNTWCPILQRRSTLDALFGPTTLDEADRILLHAIVATTLRFSTDQRLTEERRQHYHDLSKQKVLLYGLENSSVQALQALVILALDLVGSGNGPPGWNLLALITRSVVQLGLSVESNSFAVSPNFPSIYTLRAMVLPEPKSWIEDESRRRLFWMIYLLDRYATLATAFEFALDEKEIDRKLPCRDDLWDKNRPVETRWFKMTEQTGYDVDKPENLGAFSYYIEILGILSRIHKFLKKPVDISALSDVEQWQGEYRELDNVLSSWNFALPGDYGNMAKLFQSSGNKTISCSWVMLHATYHTAVVRLHSSAAYPTTRSPIFTPSYSAAQRCHGAVENIAALTEYVMQNNMLPKLGPPFAFTLWVAARLLLVHGSTISHTISPQIQLFVDGLSQMGHHWAVAHRYTTILQRVLEEHRDSEHSSAVGGERVTPSSVKILADMRRCAYDLDFLISRQPRHVGSAGARLPSITPARTPAPNELEYLDVFDFFNVPRLPDNVVAPLPTGAAGTGTSTATEATAAADHRGVRDGGARAPTGSEGPLPLGSGSSGLGLGPGNGELGIGVGSNEFNIQNFMIDANSDWLFKNQT